ncbi:MAG TPA: heavy-metal-associated domain-containing protein [Pseudonocardia sp.]|uniref:heavy-metal-associated domain-containing protein n=1 Tax=Pseudonocardia sp. TaxID=60912 RepID=UPI002CB03994|nr:heavy-metal-associated domain-containing protein [Pseudonocardia sp.]HTF46036.1 heavy-metal-associated domain-containing protein [Pseudonocardia sp.]
MTSEIFTVSGMTCQHCVASVTEEVAALPGVRQVAIDLPTGSVTVVAERRLDAMALRQAIDEAGYELMVPVGR